MPTPEEQKARIRAITGPAKAEGRGLTPEENRALLGCIGEDVTDRTTLLQRADGVTILFIDGKERGPVDWR